MGNFGQKVPVSVDTHNIKSVRTYPLFIIVLCLTFLLLKCNGDETSNINFSIDKGKLEVLDQQKPSSLLPSNIKLQLQNKDTKFINKRYRRNPTANAEVLGSNSINSGGNFRISQEQVQNSHKPIFERCDEYRPSVKEESARGKYEIISIP